MDSVTCFLYGMSYQPSPLPNKIQKALTSDFNSEHGFYQACELKKKKEFCNELGNCNLKGFYTHGDLQACNKLLKKKKTLSKIDGQKE